MNRTRPTTLAICVVANLYGMVSVTARAADETFAGDWKLDPSRSKLSDEMKVERLSPKQYRFDFGMGSPETIVIDGTDQSGIAGTTLSVSVQRPDAWKVIRKKDGRTLLEAHWVLSRDGNVLIDNFQEMAPDGASSMVDFVYHRKGEGSGFAGIWVSTSEVVKFAYILQIRPYEEDGLSIANSSSQLTRKMKLDGKDYPNMGANAAVLAASSIRRLDEHTLELTDKRSDGAVYDTQRVELSADHNALTLTVRIVGRDEPNILVFARQ